MGTNIIITKPNGSRVSMESRATATAITAAKQTWALNAEDTIAITVVSPFPQSYGIGDVITVFGRDYRLNRLPKVSKTGMQEYQYDLEFEGIQYDLMRVTYDVNINTTNNQLQDIQGDIQSQGSVLANDEATFAGVLSGLNGVVGGFTAAQGAVALFAGENENLQKIMLKVQSLMSITMGLQQVAQTLNKDSAFSLITLNKAKEWWNNLLAVGRGEQIASTAATAADTTATIASTAATTANAAAEQASNTAKTASVGATTGAAAAQAVQTASATAGTVANIGLAGAFRMVGAAIKSIPVFGWILAGISALIALVSHFVSKANESKKATEEWYNAIAENAYKPIASIMELSDKWNALGNDLEAKKQFIDNKKAFEDLGVSVRDVVDAENVLVANKTAFINAQIEKAKATIYLQQAQEKVKELIKKEQEYNAMSDTKSMWVQTSTFGTGYWVETANNEKKKAKTALDGARKYQRDFRTPPTPKGTDGTSLKKPELVQRKHTRKVHLARLNKPFS